MRLVSIVMLGVVNFCIFQLPVFGQMEKESHRHIGHVIESWKDTPGSVGLLTILEQEAEIASKHAAFAARDLSDLSSMQRHVRHVRHAIDPSTESGGPGKGYGVLQAAKGVDQHINLAANSDDASRNVKVHAEHVSTSAKNVQNWSQEILDLSKQVLDARSADQAASATRRIQQLTQHILEGTDADGDGQVSWRQGEGGVAQATQHMGIMKKREGS